MRDTSSPSRRSVSPAGVMASVQEMNYDTDCCTLPVASCTGTVDCSHSDESETPINLRHHSTSPTTANKPTSFTSSTPTNCSNISIKNKHVWCKPFFVMDFLDSVDPKALELVQERLRSPNKNEEKFEESDDTLKTNESATTGDDDESSIKRDLISPTNFHQRSVAAGNRYNARGIQKAREGSWKAALECWKNALSIREQVLDVDGIEVANVCNNLGLAYCELGRHEMSLKYLHRALKIRTDQEMLSDCAATLCNLGTVSQQVGDVVSALKYYTDCRAMREQKIHETPYHIDVARVCLAIGHTYKQAQHLEDALRAYKDALNIFERLEYDKDNHPEVLETIQDIEDVQSLTV